MADQDQEQDTNRSSRGTEGERTEPVRSRWTPKPEQILILESIFNSGMVNPPKDETVRIRKLLEKFGSVGDANVFYWFQNRRSRSRRRQRQMQAASLSGDQALMRSSGGGGGGAGAIQYETSSCTTFSPPAVAFPFSTAASSLVGSSSTCGRVQNDCNEPYTHPAPICHPEFEQNSSASSVFCPLEINISQYQTGFITVFINGVATEVPRGPLDMRAICGQDCVLFHSSGVPIAVNEYGFLEESLQHGESYFLRAAAQLPIFDNEDSAGTETYLKKCSLEGQVHSSSFATNWCLDSLLISMSTKLYVLVHVYYNSAVMLYIFC